MGAKSKIVLPECGERVTVVFKAEDEQRGVTVGPVIVTDVDRYDAWVASTPGVRVETSRFGATITMIPFGVEIDGQWTVGGTWLTRREAEGIARHYGVALGSS